MAQDDSLWLDAATGQLIDVNPFLVKMPGYLFAEFLGRRLWEVGPFKDVTESNLAFEQQTDREIATLAQGHAGPREGYP